MRYNRKQIVNSKKKKISKKNKFLFHLGHPAHFHLFKNVIKLLKKNGDEIYILIKKYSSLSDNIQQL